MGQLRGTILPAFALFLRRLITDSHLFFALKVLLALAGTLLPGLFFDMPRESVILSLGVVAGAIAEPDDSLSGRIKSLGMTLLCFVIATFSVQLLYPYPWLFALGLFASAFGFIMLGALGPRYTSISFGSLLVAIYAMLGAEHAPNLWDQPLWLCAGALWYGLVSLLWLRLYPYKPLHEQVAQLFFALSRYMAEKSRFFLSQAQDHQRIRHNLAVLNIGIVTALGSARDMLARRMRSRTDPHLERLRQLSLLAQEIQERIISSHYLYARLESDLKRSLIRDGFRELLQQLAQSTHQLGFAVLMHSPYELPKGLNWGLAALQDQLDYTHLQQPFTPELRTALNFLEQNLLAIHALLQQAEQLTGAFKAPVTPQQPDQEPPAPGAWQSLRAQLTPRAPLFRHAVRMGLCLVSGYGLLQLFDIRQGFWVLLTCLFVCQSSYTATRRRLFERIAGTLIGLLLGIPLLWLAPATHGQLLILAASAMLFFAQLRSNYSAAVIFITLYALTAFSLLGIEGSSIVLPRLLDTLLGGLLSFAAVSLLWPDWQFRRLPGLLAQSLRANRHYFEQVMLSLQGQADPQAYRIARRHAHLADSALAQAWQSMLAEPRPKRRFLRLCVSLTYRNHSLLSYISTLGAHQQRLAGQLTPEQDAMAWEIERLLSCAANAVIGTHEACPPRRNGMLPGNAPSDDALLLIRQELSLIAELANEMLRLAWLMEPLRLPRAT